MRPKRLGVYIHVPFCQRKCLYCSFVSYQAQMGDEASATYVDAALSELSVRAFVYTNDFDGWTLFIGGGTPTVLGDGQLERLVSRSVETMKRLGWDLPLEATIEANPGTIGQPKAESLVLSGVTRFSIGIQSLVDSELTRIGRLHTADGAREAFRAVSSARPESISVDIMVGLPGQDMGSLNETMKGVTELGPDHVSCYALTIEEGTPMKELVGKGIMAVPGEDEVADMLDAAKEHLVKSGFKRYEISNFAKPGHECLHNMLYWSDMPYLGIGVAAHSYDPGKLERSFNVSDVGEYVRRASAGMSCSEGIEKISRSRLISDALILSLRTREGADVAEIERKYGEKLTKDQLHALSSAESSGLAMTSADGRISLTDKGYMLSNTLFIELL